MNHNEPLDVLAMGQRVFVREVSYYRNDKPPIPLHCHGSVCRVCTDGSAWVTLDKRSKVADAHEFPASDDRGRNVRVWPSECAPATDNAKSRRKAKRLPDAPPVVPVSDFGKDHWSTFAYIECCVVDCKGILNNGRMRCIKNRHPFYDHGHDASACPTLLKGAELRNHDDWDCVDDLIVAGLVEAVGSTMNPVFALTDLGRKVAAELRAHKARGGNFASFVPA